jgi:hypothetical protein
MTDRERHADDQNLIEQQGVNAGSAVDADDDARRDERTRPEAVAPDSVDLLATEPDERVGLPEQRPGQPGQQRSVETG